MIIIIFITVIIIISLSLLSLSSNVQRHRTGKGIKCFHFIRHNSSISQLSGEKTRLRKFRYILHQILQWQSYQCTSVLSKRSHNFLLNMELQKSEISVKLNSSMSYICPWDYHLQRYYLLTIIFCELLNWKSLTYVYFHSKKLMFWLLPKFTGTNARSMF